MSFKNIILVGLLATLALKATSQTENDAVIETIIESVTENVGEDYDFSELLERLNFYRKNPIDINKADRETFQELMFLSPLQINQLIEYRKENGIFLELYELQAVSSLDVETIRKLLPFITLKEVNPLKGLGLKGLLTKGSHDLMFTAGQVVERQAGYEVGDESKSHYLGSQQRVLTRYRYHYGNSLSAALTMEKDAGEQFLKPHSIPGFDFYSASVFYKGKQLIRKLAVGDYSLQFGQGLTLWSGLSFGKGAAISTIPKSEIGLKPYSSTNEALFLRGIASTLRIKKLELTPFVSCRKVDGSLNQNEETGATEIGSITQSGLHRTATEIKNHNSISQTVYGMSSQYSSSNLRIGAIVYQTSFDRAFESGSEAYNSEDFSGTQLTNTGLFYNYGFRNIYLFGEGAHSVNSGFAYLNGAVISMSPKLAAVLLHRNYQGNYQSLFNQAIAEGSEAANEKGFYSGLVFTPNRKYEWSSYVDFFRFPWLKYRVDAPSTGYEILSQFTYTPNKRLKAVARYKLEIKQENDALENALNYLENVMKQNFRLEFNYKLNQDFQFRSRAEAVTYQKGEEKKELGFLLFQDIIYSPMRSKLSGNFRVALFDTESFNARIYAYENDVLYGFSAPAYQNKGLRFYANSRYKLRRGMDVWFRYSITSYSNLDEIGSGLDKVFGDTKSDFKVQLRLQF